MNLAEKLKNMDERMQLLNKELAEAEKLPDAETRHKRIAELREVAREIVNDRFEGE